mmetsp:Transcript_18543/g.51940  ORF Transcript_18543/g.51940 Transcript_18543/m.51940 type:complete len:283 (-) Transcript_18543:1280-2128(-)
MSASSARKAASLPPTVCAALHKKSQALPTCGWLHPRLFSRASIRLCISSRLAAAFRSAARAGAAEASMEPSLSRHESMAAVFTALAAAEEGDSPAGLSAVPPGGGGGGATTASAAAAAARMAGCGRVSEAAASSDGSAFTSKGGADVVGIGVLLTVLRPLTVGMGKRDDSGPGDCAGPLWLIRGVSPHRGVSPDLMAAAARASGVTGTPSGRDMFMRAGVSREPRMAASSGLRRWFVEVSRAAAPDSRLVGRKLISPGGSIPLMAPLPMRREVSRACSRPSG